MRNECETDTYKSLALGTQKKKKNITHIHFKPDWADQNGKWTTGGV